MWDERKLAKSTFSDWDTLKTLDVVFLIENGKNKRARISDVNITMLT